MGDPVLVTGRHTVVEVRRNLARLLSPTDATAARAAFADAAAARAIGFSGATT